MGHSTAQRGSMKKNQVRGDKMAIGQQAIVFVKGENVQYMLSD